MPYNERLGDFETVVKFIPQRIQYAKSKSDCVAKADGTYVPKEEKKKQEEKGEKLFYFN